MAVLRTWIVLSAFDLPSDPAHVCLVLFSMGAVGLLPIGIGTGPTATVAALGTTNLAVATAAGMVVECCNGPGRPDLRRNLLGLAGSGLRADPA